MRRALILICTLTALMLAVGITCDRTQTATGEAYLERLPEVRNALYLEDFDRAYELSAYLHACWQGDERWLNCLISHHHTRAVNTALMKLATAIELTDRDEALRALDETEDALTDVSRSDAALFENIL